MARAHDTPAVTLLISLYSTQPGNAADPLRLAATRTQVLDALAGASVAPDELGELGARLDQALARIELEHPRPGVAVLVAPDVTATFPVELAPAPSVTIGREFAFGPVLAALQDGLDARAIVLARGLTRCVECRATGASEREDHGFPVAPVLRGSIGNPHEDLPAGEHAHAEETLATFRAVAEAIELLHREDPCPLVLVGTEDDLASFEDACGVRVPIAARVPVGSAHAEPHELLAAVRAAMAHARDTAARAVCAEAADHLDHGVVAGLDAVCPAARAGRGRLLLVEAGFRYPVLVPASGEVPIPLSPLELAVSAAVEHLDVVDATIAAVLRAGGEVLIVPEGTLGALGRVALATRY